MLVTCAGMQAVASAVRARGCALTIHLRATCISRERPHGHAHLVIAGAVSGELAAFGGEHPPIFLVRAWPSDATTCAPHFVPWADHARSVLHVHAYPHMAVRCAHCLTE